MVTASWLCPIVQACFSPMAANQNGLNDHVLEGMLSAAEKRKPSTKWLDLSRNTQARLLHNWVIGKHDGLINTQVLPIFRLCPP